MEREEAAQAGQCAPAWPWGEATRRETNTADRSHHLRLLPPPPAMAESRSRLEIHYEYPDSGPLEARSALRTASLRLSERGLLSASKW